MSADESANGSARRLGLHLGSASVIAILAFCLGTWTRYEYLTTPGVHDDRFFEWMIAEVDIGRWSRADMLLTSHSGQVTPLGTLLYEQLYRRLGPSSVGWHTFINLAHALSAGLLFLVLRGHAVSWWGPAAASLLWGSHAIGRWDNFLLWSGSAAIAFVPVAFLLAILAVDQLANPRSLRWALVATAASLTMIFNWNVSLLLLPALGVAWLLAYPQVGSRPAIAAILVGGALVAIAGVLLTWFGLQSAQWGVPTNLDQAGRWTTALIGTPALFAVTAGDMTFWTAAHLPSEQFPQKGVVAVLLAAFIPLTSPAGRRRLIVLFVPALLFGWAAFAMRGDLGRDVILASGRYYFYPALFWCAAVGMIVDGISARLPSTSRNLPLLVLCAVVLAGHLYHQRQVASVARTQFDQLWTAELDRFNDQRTTLRELANVAPPDTSGVLPDLPLHVPPVRELYRLSTLARVEFWSNDFPWKIQPIDQMTPEDRSRASRALALLDTPAAREWRSTLRTFTEDLRAVAWLEEWLEQRKESVRVPTFELPYPGRSLPITYLIASGLAGPFDQLQVGGDEGDRERLMELLADVDHTYARVWKRWLVTVPGP